MNNSKAFSDNLRKFMKIHNINQVELSEKTGISRSNFSLWLNNQRYPRPDAIEKIANYFGIEPYELTATEKELFKIKMERFESDNELLVGEISHDDGTEFSPSQIDYYIPLVLHENKFGIFTYTDNSLSHFLMKESLIFYLPLISINSISVGDIVCFSDADFEMTMRVVLDNKPLTFAKVDGNGHFYDINSLEETEINNGDYLMFSGKVVWTSKLLNQNIFSNQIESFKDKK